MMNLTEAERMRVLVGAAAVVVAGSPVWGGPGPCGTWERVATPNPGTVQNVFVDAEEANGTVYALLATADSTQVRPPLSWHVLRRDGDAWTDLGGPTNADELLGLEFNALGVAPDGTIWVGGSFFPLRIGRNPAPVVASFDPGSGNWSAPEEIQIPNTVVEPVQRRSAEIETIEVAPDGTVFASGFAQGFGGGQQGIDGTVPLFLVNNGGGFVETFVGPGQDWPGGSSRGVPTTLFDAVAFASDDVWLAGRHDDNGTIAGGLILHWDGTTLNVERGGNTAGGQFLGRDLGGIDGNAPNDLMVAGQNMLPEPPFGTLASFDGTGWTIIPGINQDLHEIVVAQDGTAWATNVFASTQAQFFDGTSWSSEPFLPQPPAGSSVRIFSMAEHGSGDLWAFGSQDIAESYAVRLSCGPSPCNTADLTGDGTLDIADVVEFLRAFGQGDAAADLAAPFGVWDIVDVVEFLRIFGAGCP